MAASVEGDPLGSHGALHGHHMVASGVVVIGFSQTPTVLEIYQDPSDYDMCFSCRDLHS